MPSTSFFLGLKINRLNINKIEKMKKAFKRLSLVCTLFATILFTSCSEAFWMGMLAGMMSYPYGSYDSYGSSYNSYGSGSVYSTTPTYSTNSTYTPSSSSSSSTQQRQPRKCSACDGTGRVIKNDVASFGQTKYCSECKKTVSASHYHGTCPSCKGKGYW